MSDRDAGTIDREANDGSTTGASDGGSSSSDIVDRAKESDATSVVDGSDAFVAAAGASVLFSWYQYHVRGNKHYGLFTGLWAPTILAFASYIQDADMRQAVDQFSSE
jgi:hypothetical protein